MRHKWSPLVPAIGSQRHLYAAADPIIHVAAFLSLYRRPPDDSRRPNLIFCLLADSYVSFSAVKLINMDRRVQRYRKDLESKLCHRQGP